MVRTRGTTGKVISKSIKNDKVYSIIELPDPKWEGQTQCITILGDLELGHEVDICVEWLEG